MIALRSIKKSIEDILRQAIALQEYFHASNTDQYSEAYEMVLKIYQQFIAVRTPMVIIFDSGKFAYSKNLRDNFSNAFALSATILADVVEDDFSVRDDNLLSFCRLNSKRIVDDLNFVLKDWSKVSAV